MRYQDQHTQNPADGDLAFWFESGFFLAFNSYCVLFALPMVSSFASPSGFFPLCRRFQT